MAWELEYDDTQVPPDRPCAKCASIGNHTVCVRQLRDKTQPSCLSEITTGIVHGTVGTITGDLKLARYGVDYLRQSVVNGCYLCRTLLYNLEQEMASDVDLSLSVQQRAPQNYLNMKMTFVPYGMGLIDLTMVQDFSDKRLNGPGQPGSFLSMASTKCRAGMDRLRQLHSACLIDHRKCAETHLAKSSTPYLPTRLLDLSDCKTTGMISLVDSHNLSARTVYMTLSHTWGAKPCLKLTTLTRNTLAAGFRIEALPLTLREACFVALELQCNHIWIDSLCIIQDSEADWLDESSLMVSVYANSSLTIAASAAEDSHSGLYHYRDLRHYLASITFHCACETGSFGVAEHDGSPCNSGDFPWLPLHQRAWVHQELALSRRIAYFTDVQIIWICQEEISGELDTRPGSPAVDAAQMKPRIPQYSMSCMLSEKPKLPLPEEWRRTIEDYSVLELTYARDRLIAVAAMARLYHSYSQGSLGRYCAGLWEQSLAHDLAWCRDEPSEPLAAATNICDKYRAPTWSWAHDEGQISWWRHKACDEDDQDVSMVDIIRVDIAPVSDPFGALREGRVRLAGCMVRMVAISNDTQATSTHSGTQVWFDDAGSVLHKATRKAIPLYFMRLLEHHTQSAIAYVMALCLVPSFRRHGEYRRVGIAPSIDIKDWESAQASSAYPIQDSAHLGRREDGKYIIDLV